MMKGEKDEREGMKRANQSDFFKLVFKTLKKSLNLLKKLLLSFFLVKVLKYL